MPNFNMDAIFDLVQQGFIVGAAIGVILGSFTWSMLNPGLPSMFPMIIMGVVGFLGGVAVEGGAFLKMLNPSLVLFSSGGSSGTFGSLVAVIGWIIGGLALGAAISDLPRAMIGAILGVVMGTVAGMMILSLDGRYAIPADTPAGTIVIGVAVMLFVFLTSLGQGTSRR